ncbi:PQQ-dependent sugar dehydrogenase [Nocardioides sp. Soil805]|uniref:PQQ-dependent sugar dehydrogenase n=1 Tax=Nocardioides sp. Soil805 TaxID=1736416 RepID=UPI0007027DCD|nr:PQQ-dependent sugar dehydrogenase [Nocardioides sp. Soil805]KRF36501.1 glucose sorbosone dehydrogenase [Nocardioides sp. Soil805]
MRARLAAASALLGVSVLSGCADDGAEPRIPSVTQPTDATPDGPASTPSGSGSGSARGEAPRVTGTVASGLEVPWGIEVFDDGTALVTERDSRRVLSVDDSGEVSQVGEVSEAEPEGEGGLLGIAVDPASDGRDVYLYATTADDNRVLRAELDEGRLGPAEVVLDGIPKGFIHDGGRLVFGPDGFLYVSTGETGDRDLAQDPDSLAGKILRITTDGEPAPGNPDPGSPVWSLGHRNVQGLAFDDEGRLWASEFGESTYDEINLIEPGANYGWPLVEGPGGGDDFVDPLVTWPTSAASPSGMAYADGQLWVGALRGERLWRVPVLGNRLGEPVPYLEGEYGRLRTVVATPGGDLWVTTSNRDGRGTPADEDDRILRVTPSG